ncbi:MAG: tRNA (adenosine(37)-N6)-threonylcarbamoyltransferase complex dimerization subunit type 1 TsaB [Firmicutes bacterium]|nr:tRNA (adenosine(37)-N6)-threonylcarbamoyltransferase complex dimerization subunit type 1 TsaB [Bacillota bacterium]
MNILHIDAAFPDFLRLVVYSDREAGGEIFEANIKTQQNVSALLLPSIDDILKTSNVQLKDIDYYSVIVGPGSWTGLRLAITTVKTLCMNFEKPAIAVGAFDILEFCAKQNSDNGNINSDSKKNSTNKNSDKNATTNKTNNCTQNKNSNKNIFAIPSTAKEYYTKQQNNIQILTTAELQVIINQRQLHKITNYTTNSLITFIKTQINNTTHYNTLEPFYFKNPV